MKKYAILLLSLFLCVGAIDAGTRRGKRGTVKRERLTPTEQAAKLSSIMQLSDDVSAQFVPIYINYCQELNEVFSKYPITMPAKNEKLSDEQIKINNDNRFAVARALVDVREKYYKKFSKVLTPSQVDMLYRSEKRFRHTPRVAYRRQEASDSSDSLTLNLVSPSGDLNDISRLCQGLDSGLLGKVDKLAKRPKIRKKNPAKHKLQYHPCRIPNPARTPRNP